jgi:hypothetical protein
LAERKLLHLRRDDRCSVCDLGLPAGSQAYWVKPDRLVLCTKCGADPADELEPQAGAGARREYERRRQNRIDRTRERYGRIGGWIAEHSNGPQHEQAWARGARGEEDNARRLERRLASEPVALLHDRRWPGRRANIDHIAIGPAGVTVIDSKKLSGKVKVDAQGGLFSERRYDLYVNGRRRTNLVDGVERQMDLVRMILADEGLGEIPVRGALCMADPEGLPLLGHLRIGDVAIDATRHISKLIAEPGELDSETVESVRAALDRRLPAA